MNNLFQFSSFRRSSIHFTWKQKSLALIIISIIANHLIEPDNFPLSDSYNFPLFSIITSIVIGALILVIAELNFKKFERKHYLKAITTENIFFFLLSTLGIISIAYILIFYLLVWLQDGDHSIFNLLVGLSITLLISCLMIIATYSRPIYYLFKLEVLNGKLVIEKDSKKILINYSDIAYILSENKIVYVIQVDGQAIATDFTLNEIENKINSQLFLRANRQTLIHSRSIKEIKPIENGKLSITLEPTIFGKQMMQIGISRYKKKEFNEWFKKKQK